MPRATAATIARRVGVRTAAALWRQRLTLLVVVGAAGLFAVYQVSAASPAQPAGDCADTAMAAVTNATPETAHAAYECLGSDVQRMTEQAFAASLRAQGEPAARLTRVGDHRAPDGGRVVFYAVDQGAQAVGYIVYLDRDGKIFKIE